MRESSEVNQNLPDFSFFIEMSQIASQLKSLETKKTPGIENGWRLGPVLIRADAVKSNIGTGQSDHAGCRPKRDRTAALQCPLYRTSRRLKLGRC